MMDKEETDLPRTAGRGDGRGPPVGGGVGKLEASRNSLGEDEPVDRARAEAGPL